MNMHVQPDISGVANPCLFEVGNIVRIGKTLIGRVIEDTPHEGATTKVQIFSDPESFWGPDGIASFGPGLLTLLVDAPPHDFDRLPPAVVPLDIGEIQTQTFKILQAWELIGTLVQTEI